MTREKTSDWEDLIAEAACSGIDISEFCSLHGLSRSWFYRMARRLGYMDGGRRTEKWEAAASGARTRTTPQPRAGPCRRPREDRREACMTGPDDAARSRVKESSCSPYRRRYRSDQSKSHTAELYTSGGEES